MDHQRRVVAAVGVFELSAGRVVDPVEGGDEHGRLVVLVEEVVDLAQHLARVALADARALQQGAGRHHEQGGGNALVGDVGDGQADPAVLQVQDVEEVAPHAAGWLHVAEDAVARPPGELGGKDGLLDLAGHVQLVLQGDQLVPRRERLAPLGHVAQGPVYGDPEVLKVEWLGDEVERAPVHGSADVLHVAVGRDDHRPDVGVHLGYLLEQGEAVHAGHVDVGDHHVDVVLALEPLEGLHPVGGEDELIVAGPDVAAHPLQHQHFDVGLVVDHEDLVRVVGHLPLPVGVRFAVRGAARRRRPGRLRLGQSFKAAMASA